MNAEKTFKIIDKIVIVIVIVVTIFIIYGSIYHSVPPKVYSQTPELVAEKDDVKFYRFYQFDNLNGGYMPVYFTDHGNVEWHERYLSGKSMKTRVKTIQ